MYLNEKATKSKSKGSNVGARVGGQGECCDTLLPTSYAYFCSDTLVAAYRYTVYTSLVTVTGSSAARL
jgi:hypothetical protein